MKSYRSIKRGFTLVEILIVVIILGILAAIVIPQFTNASEDARKSSLTTQLQTIRAQISLYKLQHRDQAPALADFWDKMTKATDDSGDTFAAGTSESGPFGKYFESAVVNPLTGKSELAATAGASVGWVYDEATGEVHGINKAGAQSDTGN